MSGINVSPKVSNAAKQGERGTDIDIIDTKGNKINPAFEDIKIRQEIVKTFLKKSSGLQKTLSGNQISDIAIIVLRELHASKLSGEISNKPVSVSRFFQQDNLNSWGCC